MFQCEQVQAQLIDRLYDLLEPDEVAAFDAHVASCASCSQALTKARQFQELVSRAAKREFPEVRFSPPPAVTPASVQPAAAAPAPPARWLRRVKRLALAAALLLAVTAVTVPTANHAVRYVGAVREVARLDSAKLALRAELQQIEAQALAQRQQVEIDLEQARQRVEQAEAQWQAARDQAVKTLNDRRMYLMVTGPETVQAGAPNDYTIETLNLNNQHVPAKLDIKVSDKKTGEVLYEERDVRTTGQHRVSLPIDLKYGPGSDIALDIRARGEALGLPQTELTDRLLIAAPVYLTHLATDRPLYQPGDTVYFRSLTLNRNTLQPASAELTLHYALHRADSQGNPQGPPIAELTGTSKLERLTPKGREALLGPDQQPIRGIGTGALSLPADAASGWYVLSVREANNRFPTEQRKLLVDAYTPPRLTKQLEFDRKSYGPGDPVVVNLKVARPEGGALAHAKVNATVKVDGNELPPIAPTLTDALGQARLAFQLPGTIERGEAVLSVQVQDQAGTETLVRLVPVVVQRLYVDFYPEGGDLVAGVPNRVYFQARTPLGRPAQLRGRLVESNAPQRVLAHVETFNDPNEPGINQGQGSFTFTPSADTAYSLLVDSPAGMTTPLPLPKVRPGGVVLSVPTGVTGEGEDLKVLLHSPDQERTLRVGAYARGRVLDDRRVVVPKGEAVEVRLRPSATLGGVTRVTVFEERKHQQQHRLIPVAERLVYRKSGQRLNLAVQADKTRYSPGESVQLTLSATDERGQPTAAVAMVGVVNHSVVSLADEKNFRSMPTHFLLTSEVRRPEELEYADVLLSDHPKAAYALDLLLGTQGWRRFAEQDPRRFQERNNPREAEALLVRIGRQKDAHLVDSQHRQQLEEELTRIDEQYTQLYAQAVEQQERIEQQLAGLGEDPELANRREQIRQQSQELELARVQAAQALASLEAINSRIQMLGYPLLMLVGLGVMVWSLIRAAQRQLRQATPYYALAGATAALCAVLVGHALLGDRVLDQPAETRELAQAPEPKLALPEPIREPQPITQPLPPDQPGLGVSAPGLPKAAIPQQTKSGQASNPNRPNLDPNSKQAIVAPPGASPLELVKDERVNKPADAVNAGLDVAKADNLHLNESIESLEKSRSFLGRGGMAKQGKLDGSPTDLKRNLPEMQQESPDAKGNRKATAASQPVLVRPPSFIRPSLDKAELTTKTKQLQVPSNNISSSGGPSLPAPAAPGAAPGFGRPMPQLPPADRQATVKGDGLSGDLLGGIGREVVENRNIQLRQAVNSPPLIVREYAHRVEPNRPVRDDFTETVLWQPVLIIPQQGVADVRFDLSDHVGRYEVLVAAHTLDGRLGALQHEIEARKPFSLDPRLPQEIGSTDRVEVPLTLVNDTAIERSVQLVASPTGLVFSKGNPQRQRLLAPQQRAREIFSLMPAKGVLGQVRLRFDALSEPFAPDTVERRLTVLPEGFPVVKARNGQLDKATQTKLVLPSEWVPGTLRLRLQVYPSVLADLQQALDGLLHPPSSGFEQTLRRNYPSVLILNYLKTHDRADPALLARARTMLERGYSQLFSLECRDAGNAHRGGFDWFGGTSPPNETLTACGLLQLRELAQVYPVDPAFVARTHQYLLDRRDGQGGFKRHPQASQPLGQLPAALTDAFIIWAITESERDRAAEQRSDLSTEIRQLLKRTEQSKDPYLLALAANSLLNLQQVQAATPLLQRLQHLQQQGGYLEGSEQRLSGPHAEHHRIETTALAVLGLAAGAAGRV
jgi:hypothetical protein